MPITDLHYRHMRIGQLQRLARQGDPGAIRAAIEMQEDLTRRMRPLSRIPEALGDLARAPLVDPAALRRISDSLARDKSAAISRQEAMLREMALLRETAERAAAREAAADKRAYTAEEREAAAAKRSERRERVLVGLTVASTVAALISVAAFLA